MEKMDLRRILAEVSLGNIPPDIVISHATVFNAFTAEFIPEQSIWIKDGSIAYVGPEIDIYKSSDIRVIDVDGMVVLPGLIDAHTHIASTKSEVDEFVRFVIPGGTTTVVTETMDLPFVVGEEGLKHWLEGFRDQPIRIYYTAPSLCGLTPQEEVFALDSEHLLPYLSDPQCLGLGEIYWSNAFLPGRQGERLLELFSSTFDHGKRVEGHTAGASGRKLQAYTALGISSCHEPVTEEEVLDRVRLGYWVMIREGSVRKELERVWKVFYKRIDFRRIVISTDSIDPVDILEEGYLEAAVRRILRLGVPPERVYQMVTINPAEHFHLDNSIGAIAPGRFADLVVIPSPQDYTPRVVMCEGNVIFEEGRMLVEPRKSHFPPHLFATIKPGDFVPPSTPLKGKVRAIELVTNLVTRERIVDLDRKEEASDLNFVLAVDRTAGGGSFLGILKGFGLKKGAVGSTMCWDTGDMLVAGCDFTSMTTVIERLKEIGGGIVFAIDREIVAELATPICGFLSPEPMRAIRERMKRIEEALRAHGVSWPKPTMTIETLTTAAIPHLRITHHGYVRLKDRKVLTCDIQSD